MISWPRRRQLQVLQAPAPSPFQCCVRAPTVPGLMRQMDGMCACKKKRSVRSSAKAVSCSRTYLLLCRRPKRNQPATSTPGEPPRPRGAGSGHEGREYKERRVLECRTPNNQTTARAQNSPLNNTGHRFCLGRGLQREVDDLVNPLVVVLCPRGK